MFSRSLFRSPIINGARAFSTTPVNPFARMSVIGRLAADPELSPTSTGKEIIKFTVATGYGPKDNRQTSYFRIVSFETNDKRRDFLLQLQKGQQVFVEADAQNQKYQAEDGTNKTSLSLILRNVEALSRPQSAAQSEGEAAAYEPESGIGQS